MREVTVIIPAYNEAGRIGKVLANLRDVVELRQILVVDDGSTDSTADEVLKAALLDDRVKLVSLPVNQGKGGAVLAGVAGSHTPYILMLDADLEHLAAECIHELMRPVLNGRADMTLGVFRGGRLTTDFAHWATPWLTGQRCLRADIFDSLGPETAAGYGLETALTVVAQKRGLRVLQVPLRGVWHPSSEFHRGIGPALHVRARMYREIWKSWVANGGPDALQARFDRARQRFVERPLRAWSAARKRFTRVKE